MRMLGEDIELAAQSTAPVLIAGESGVGKETVARVIHARSARAGGPFISFRCTDLPGPLLTALNDRLDGSRVDAPRIGTLLLKEIGALEPRRQAELFEFLEMRWFRGVNPEGAARIPDVRVIATTEARLIRRGGEQSFRQDLYYRVNVLYLEVPPLRDRRTDLPALLTCCLAVLAAQEGRPVPELAPDAHAALLAYDWPGNMRELTHTVRRLIVHGEGGAVRLDDLPPELRRNTDRLLPEAEAC
jgi:DNA-binding NtrC family response regulator